MSLSSATISGAVAQQVGNVLKNEGIDAAKPVVDCSPRARKHLGRLIVRLMEKCTPYTQKNVSDGFSIISILQSCLEGGDRLIDKSLQLATRLYETGTHLQIPPSTLLTLCFDGKNDSAEAVRGVALLAFSHDSESLAYRADGSGRSMDCVGSVNEHSLERMAIWLEESGKVLVLEKKNTPVKYWIENFLGLKPVLTENRATLAASQWIKKVSEQIDSARESSEFKQKMNDMLAQASSVSFEDIESCAREYLGEDAVEQIRERIEKQTSLSLQGEYELPADLLQQKVQQFVKTLRVTPQLDVTIKGKQEVVSMERLPSEEADAIVIKLKLKEEQ